MNSSHRTPMPTEAKRGAVLLGLAVGITLAGTVYVVATGEYLPQPWLFVAVLILIAMCIVEVLFLWGNAFLAWVKEGLRKS